MLHEFHLTIHREPVGMNIPEAHEDGNHQAAVTEVGSILHLFYHHNLSVGWCYYQFRSILYVEVSDRTTVEVEYDTIYRTEHNNKAQNGILLSKVVHNIAAMATNAIAPVTS